MRRIHTLLFVIVILLLSTFCLSFNPHESDGDSIAAEPSTSSLECETIDGELKCHKKSGIDLDAILADEGYAEEIAEEEDFISEDGQDADAMLEEVEKELEKLEREKIKKEKELEREREKTKAENWKQQHVHSTTKKKGEEEKEEEKKTEGEQQQQTEKTQDQPKQDEKKQERKRQDNKKKESKLPSAVKKLKISYYKLLEVAEDATTSQIRKTFNKLAIVNHPDKCPQNSAIARCKRKREETMLVLNEAKEVLLNEEKRAKYDFLLNFGYKVFDEDLYEEVKYAYDNDLEYDDGWFWYDPDSDPYESMDLRDYDETFIFYLSVAFTALLVIVPIVKLYERRKTSVEKKQILKSAIHQTRKDQQAAIDAMPSKTPKFTGDRTQKRSAQEQNGGQR